MIEKWVVDLAEQKLGSGATVRKENGEWVAERISGGKVVRVTAKTRDILVWFLERFER